MAGARQAPRFTDISVTSGAGGAADGYFDPRSTAPTISFQSL